MLLAAPGGLPNSIDGLQPVSVAASVGLFTITTDMIDTVIERIAKTLTDSYPHLTFVVDAASLDVGFENAYQQVLAKNRFRQFMQPTLSTPEYMAVRPETEKVCCEFDRVRPVDHGSAILERRPSRTVRERREYGQDQHRRNFYENELGEKAAGLFKGQIGMALT